MIFQVPMFCSTECMSDCVSDNLGRPLKYSSSKLFLRYNLSQCWRNKGKLQKTQRE